MAPAARQPWGLYIHVPFCVTKCPYCDFYSVTEPDLRAAWLRAVEREIAAVDPDTVGPFDTL